jgi:TRAP-type C4-dicarboxylate transport system substrate-binding protein
MAYQRKYSQDNTADAIAKIKASGTTVTEVDLKDWIEFSQQVYTQTIPNTKLNPEIIKKLQAAK